MIVSISIPFLHAVGGRLRGRGGVDKDANMELPDIFMHWANCLLVWVGFGTLAGLLAKAIMPGRDPGGAMATVIIGVSGTIIGGGSLAFFSEGLRVEPLSPVGFVLATAGAFLLLFLYRVLAGKVFREGGTRPRLPRGRRARRVSVVHEE
jgi:uncharacterized membrane protein YeaQ/YmgE (transglycosylase-associated protein family)